MNITRQLNVNASAGLLWHILAEEYDQVGEWTTAVLYSGPNPDLPVGEGRVCATPAFGDVKETITQFDESARSFSYAVDIADGPFFLRGVDNTWRIESQGNDQSVVFMTRQFICCPSLRS